MRFKWFAPNSAPVWSFCPGSVKLSQDYLDLYEKSEAQLEGVAAHWVAEQLFKKSSVTAGTLAPNGVPVTEEMIEFGQDFVSLLPEDTKIEDRINLDHISQGMYGYVDAHFTIGTTLYIINYKYGHSPVDPYENKQLLCEAAGLVNEGHTHVCLGVFQPRSYIEGDTVRSWKLTLQEFSTYLADMIESAKLVLAENPEIHTGPHCSKCPARQACEALRKSTLTVVDISQSASTLDIPAEHLGRELAVLMDAQDRIKARLAGLEAQATSLIQSGTPIEGFELSASFGHYKWNLPDEVILGLGTLWGVDLKRPAKPVTPAQAAKLDGVSIKTIERLRVRPTNGHNLKRINTNKLRKAFKND